MAKMFQAFLFTTQIALKILRGSHASNFVIKVELNIEVFTTIWEKNCHNLGFALQILFLSFSVANNSYWFKQNGLHNRLLASLRSPHVR